MRRKDMNVIKRPLILAIVLSAVLIGMPAVGVAADGAGVTLTPVNVSRLYALADSIQSDGAGGYLGDGVYDDDEWNVLTDPLVSPSASAEDDPFDPNVAPFDGWTLAGFSSFATASSEMTDASGWSTFDDSDTFKLFVNNQATQDPGGGAYGPEGWGYSVSYLLITYDTAPTGGHSYGDPMTVTLDVDFSSEYLWASDIYDDYFLDVGYALGTGLTDYDPVVVDPANNPNPGQSQFAAYHSWRHLGPHSESPTFSDSLEYNGVIGEQVQVLSAVSSFSYSWWGYTWTDATLTATVTATTTSSIGDYVWVDDDGDGIQDAGESGLDGVTVKLYDSSHNPKGTTTTSGGGFYSFTNLTPGDYYVEFVEPTDYDFTDQDQGSDAADSDADPTTGKTAVTTLISGETDLTWDAGLEYTGGPTAVTLSSFAAKPSAGGSVSPLWLGLAGLTMAAGSLFWTKRRVG